MSQNSKRKQTKAKENVRLDVVDMGPPMPTVENQDVHASPHFAFLNYLNVSVVEDALVWIPFHGGDDITHQIKYSRLYNTEEFDQMFWYGYTFHFPFFLYITLSCREPQNISLNLNNIKKLN